MAEIYYKDIAILDEANYGVSTSADFNTEVSRLHITSFGLKKEIDKSKIEETNVSNKGRVRMTKGKNSIEGDMELPATPRNLHHSLELVNGSRGVTTGVGVSATLIEYAQAGSGNKVGKTIMNDKINTQERFTGVLAKNFEMSASDDLVELSLGLFATGQGLDGVALDDLTGETIAPFEYSDVTITLSPGTSYGASALTIKTNEWSISYDNGLEALYQSGDGVNSAKDPSQYYYGIPEITGSLTVLHEGTTFINSYYGCTNWYMRIEGNLTSCDGLIAGVSAYRFRIDIPKLELTANTREYEEGELAVEEIEFEGLFEHGVSALWKPSITTALDNQ